LWVRARPARTDGDPTGPPAHDAMVLTTIGGASPTLLSIAPAKRLPNFDRAHRATGGRAVFDIVPRAHRPPSRHSQCLRGQSPCSALQSWAPALRKAVARPISVVTALPVALADHADRATLTRSRHPGGWESGGRRCRQRPYPYPYPWPMTVAETVAGTASKDACYYNRVQSASLPPTAPTAPTATVSAPDTDKSSANKKPRGKPRGLEFWKEPPTCAPSSVSCHASRRATCGWSTPPVRRRRSTSRFRQERR